MSEIFFECQERLFTVTGPRPCMPIAHLLGHHFLYSKLPPVDTPLEFDCETYKKHLCAKFTELQGMVEANLFEAASKSRL